MAGLTTQQQAELRAQGMHPVEVWVPDMTRADVRADVATQCRRIQEHEVQAQGRDAYGDLNDLMDEAFRDIGEDE